MRRYISTSTLLVGLCALLVALVFTNFGLAQEQELTGVRSIQVKPGMGAEFENFLKNDVIPALKKGGVQSLGVWKTAILGVPDLYVMTSPIDSIAELDDPSPLVKGVGEDGLAAMMAKMQKLISSSRMIMVEGRPDLGIAPPSDYVSKLCWRVKIKVAPGRNEDYEKTTKMIMELVKKTNAKGVYANQTVMGGNPNEYYTVVLLDSFSDMEKYIQAMGKELATAKIPSVDGVIEDMQYEIFSYIPELSIQAPAQ